ncbi:hypothetical protein NTE28_001334 [Vibrio harveyi]|nr:hypothetical protein [Vibrio harveyi]
MPVDKVWLHNSFQNGSVNNEYFKDFQYFNEAEIDLLLEFIDAVIEGKPLKGRNKPSWHDSSGSDIKVARGYKESNVWHYHAGPFTESAQLTTSNIRQANYAKNTSDAVFHYTWRGTEQTELIILGFSPQHETFPLPSDKGNPLRNRMRVAGKYPDASLKEAKG